MKIIIKPVNEETLVEYSRIPISFEVKSKLNIDLIDDGLCGIVLREQKVARPYIKNYDKPEENPTTWPKRFNISNWGLFLISKGETPIGGVVVVCNTPDVNMLDGRDDLAVIWDIRVHPDYRQSGIGTKLFTKAVEWSKRKGCKQLKVETQNINIPACKFYSKQGCKIGSINRYAYHSDPLAVDEIQLIWCLDLWEK